MSRDRVEAEAWSYDGSIESLFILVDLALENGAAPTAVLRSDLIYSEPSLFDEPRALCPVAELPADSKAASTAATRIRLRSDTLFDLCLRAWMSEEGVESELLFVAAGVGCSGDELAWDYARPQVRILRAACHRVDREIHRLQGLARFSPRDDGLYVAPLEPDHNIIAALVPHFARRFVDQSFALVDLRRELAFESRGGRLRGCAGAAALALLPERFEDEDSLLWRQYFQATENPARQNPTLQRSFMPSRYWKYLPELSTSLKRPERLH